MDREQAKQIERKIERLAQKKKFQDKDVYVFSASDGSRRIIRALRGRGLEPANVIDNDPAKRHSFWARIRVIALDEIPVPSEPKNVFLVYSKFWREILEQLDSCGVRKENVYCFYGKATFADRLLEAWKGRGIYRKIVKKYGNVPVFICPYTGTGDVYLIGTFWKQYIRRNHIHEYAFLVLNGACKKVALLFDISNIEVIGSEAACTCLMSYYRLCPEEVNMKILNDSWWEIHTNPLQWFRGYKGLGFTELFRRFVFELPDEARPEPPMLKDREAELERLFKENRLEEGKTVVLSPYSNTLSDLPDEFWEAVARRCKEEGHIVCTNSGGGEEPPVAGTIPVFFPLDIAPQFVSRAGHFIGIRSGFCDVVSAAKAKKVILYDEKNRFFQCSAFEYFSLKRMGLCNDAVEMQFHNENCMEYVEEIVEAILRRRMDMECSID